MKKPVIASAAALGLVAAAVLLPAAGASAAPTPVDIDVTSSAAATDGSGQITDEREFLYDSAKGDTAETGYQITYSGALDMTRVWSSYRSFKSLWLLLNSNDTARWSAKTFTGEWTIGFTVDTGVVQANDAFVDCGTLQDTIAAQNPDTRFGDIMRCDDVSFDAAAGLYEASFLLTNIDGTKVTGAQLDASEHQPSTLTLTTPAHAFYVPQSAFEPGRTFDMTDAFVSGQMAMDAFFIGMPLTFDDAADPVSLTMIDTQDARFEFESADPAETLPAEVLDLLPETRTMLRDGDEVTAPALAADTVSTPAGTWTFDGWNPDAAIIDGDDVVFTGTWSFDANLFSATYAFASADAERDLPAAVTDLLPDATAELRYGQEFTAPAPAATSVETADGTWTFNGWTPASATITDTDVAFTGTWSFALAPVVPPDPEDEDGTDPDEGTEPDEGTKPDDGNAPDEGTEPDDANAHDDGTVPDDDAKPVDEPSSNDSDQPDEVTQPAHEVEQHGDVVPVPVEASGREVLPTTGSGDALAFGSLGLALIAGGAAIAITRRRRA